MDLRKYVNNPEVALYLRKFAAGQYIFQQGQMSSSAYFVIEGLVELVTQADDTDYREVQLGPGQFLGEKALLAEAPYQRRFGAVAREATRVLEIKATDLDRLQRAAPGLVVELLRTVLRNTTERLDRMNFLVNALRSTDFAERFIALVHYSCRTIGRREEAGVEVELDPENMARYIGTEVATITRWIEELVLNGVVLRRRENRYLVPNQADFEEFVRRHFAGKVAA